MRFLKGTLLFLGLSIVIFACKTVGTKTPDSPRKKVIGGTFDENNSLVIPLPDELQNAPLSTPGEDLGSSPKGLNLADEETDVAVVASEQLIIPPPSDIVGTEQLVLRCFGEDKRFKSDPHYYFYANISIAGKVINARDQALTNCGGGEIQLGLTGLRKTNKYNVTAMIYYRFDIADRSRVRIDYKGETKDFVPEETDKALVLEKQTIDENVNVNVKNTEKERCIEGGYFWNGAGCRKNEGSFVSFAYTVKSSSTTTNKTKTVVNQAMCMKFDGVSVRLAPCQADDTTLKFVISYHTEKMNTTKTTPSTTITSRYYTINLPNEAGDTELNGKCLFANKANNSLNLANKDCPIPENGTVPAEFLFEITPSLVGDQMGRNTFSVSSAISPNNKDSYCISVPYASASNPVIQGVPSQTGSIIDLKPCKGFWGSTTALKKEEEETVPTQFIRIMSTDDLNKGLFN